MGKESRDSGTQESETSDEGSQVSRGHSAPTAEAKHPTPKVEEAPSDSGARRQRQSATPSEHQRTVQPRPTDSPKMGTSSPRRTTLQSENVRLEQARRREAVARETTVRRRQRLDLNQRRVVDAEREEKEASAELTRAEWAAGQQARTDDSVAVAPSPSPVRVRDVYSRSTRMGDDDFMDGSVSYMASVKRHEFAVDLRTEVIQTASALLTSVRLSSFKSPELLSVRQAWSDMDHSTWRGQQEAGPTLALVTALRRAHDATETPVLWPTPQDALEELRRTKRRRGDSRDERDYRRGDGGSGGDGGNGGGSSNGGGGNSHNRRGGNGGGRGGTPGGGSGSRTRPTFGRGSRDSSRSSRGGRGGRRDGARGRASGKSSTFSSSSVSIRTTEASRWRQNTAKQLLPWWM